MRFDPTTEFPFASPNALFNFSKLSVWWLRLGIDIERIKPGRPQQNGRHERMHLTIVLAGQRVGIKEIDDGIWIVSFMRYDLGYID